MAAQEFRLDARGQTLCVGRVSERLCPGSTVPGTARHPARRVVGLRWLAGTRTQTINKGDDDRFAMTGPGTLTVDAGWEEEQVVDVDQ